MASSVDVSHTAGTVHLNSIGQIALTVRDIAEAKEFYQNALGMKFLFDAGAMVFFQCGTVRIMLSATENSPIAAGTIVYFRVSGIQDVYASLKAKGVEFADEPHLIARMPDHDLWMVFLKDPTGNVIGLMSEVARSEAPQIGS